MNQEKKVYIGIDVSKRVLDVVVLPNNKYMQFKNEPEDIDKLVAKLSLFSGALIVMESTGGYEKALAEGLYDAGLSVCVTNPRQVRDFAKALGKLAKTDKIDAQVIALFASKVEPKPTVYYTKETKTLSENSARRNQLIEMIKMEKNRLDKASSGQKKSIERVLEVLEKELATINEAQATLIEGSSELLGKKEILVSVDGIGAVTAANILSELPEIGTLGPKQLGSLVGVVPFNRDSGTLRGKRTIWGGRASVRRALYMPTLVAIKHNAPIKAFYERLCATGKAKKSALIACMRKLLIIMNALIRKKEKFKDAEVAESTEMAATA